MNRNAIFTALMFAVRAIPDTRDVAQDRAFTNGDTSATTPERGLEIRSFMQTLNMFCLSMGIFEGFVTKGSPQKYQPTGGGIDIRDGVLGDRIAALCSLDAVRTRQYCLALDSAIQDKLAARRSGLSVSQEKIRIFDVGCGPFPLYSFYAAMAYPDLVECIAVEKNPKSFQIASAVVQHLGLAGSIKLVEADALKDDLYITPDKPDIVVTETFNIGGIQEHGLNILKNCWKHTDSSCITIPQRVTIHAALTDAAQVEKLQDSYVRGELRLDYLHFDKTTWASQIAAYGRGEQCEDVIEADVPIPKSGDFRLLGWAEYELYGPHRLGRPDSWISSPAIFRHRDTGTLLMIAGAGDEKSELKISYLPGADTLKAYGLNATPENPKVPAVVSRTSAGSWPRKDKSRSREVNPAGSPALTIDHSWGPGIAESDKSELLSIINSALQITQSAAPSTDNLFQWSADRDVVKYKRFQLHITTSSDPAWSKVLNRGDKANSPEIDAASIMFLNDDATFDIVTALFVDKLFFNSDGSERPDGFAQAVVTLAHEIYGNVQHNLELDPGEYLGRRLSPAEELAIEIRSFKAAGEFGERLRSNEIYSQLSEGTQEALEEAVGRERQAMVGLEQLAQRELNQ